MKNYKGFRGLKDLKIRINYNNNDTGKRMHNIIIIYFVVCLCIHIYNSSGLQELSET